MFVSWQSMFITTTFLVLLVFVIGLLMLVVNQAAIWAKRANDRDRGVINGSALPVVRDDGE